MNTETDKDTAVTDNVIEFPESGSVESQAAGWLARLDGEQCSAADREAFQRWVNQSPAHRDAFRSVARFWSEMNVLTEVVTPRELGVAPARRAPRMGMRPAIVMSMLLVCVIALAWSWLADRNQNPLVYETAIGEQKRVLLDDNSSVMLNTHSRIEVRYSAGHRRLMLDEGEAFFEVTHDADRPFEVYADGKLVRAVGTAFGVRIRQSNNLEVMVTEGTVRVGVADANRPLARAQRSVARLMYELAPGPVPHDSAAPGTVSVPAGSAVEIRTGTGGSGVVVQAVDVNEKLSWRNGTLMFQHARLAEVVAEFSRYTRTRIAIPEPALREIAIGGVFRVGDTESLFEALREGFGIEVEQIGPDAVNLVQRTRG